MKRSILLMIKISFILGAFCVTACANWENSDRGFQFDEKKFMSEWDAWNNQNITSYSFILEGKLPYWNWNSSRAIYMEKYEVKIIVKNGIMDSFEYIGKTPHDEIEEKSILPPEFTSIPDLYQRIYDWAQEEKQWWKEYPGDGHIISTKYDIKYNTELHYIKFFEPVSRWKSGVIVDTTAHAVTISDIVLLDTN